MIAKRWYVIQVGGCSIKHGRQSRGLRGQHNEEMSGEREFLGEASAEELRAQE